MDNPLIHEPPPMTISQPLDNPLINEPPPMTLGGQTNPTTPISGQPLGATPYDDFNVVPPTDIPNTQPLEISTPRRGQNAPVIRFHDPVMPYEPSPKPISPLPKQWKGLKGGWGIIAPHPIEARMTGRRRAIISSRFGEGSLFNEGKQFVRTYTR